MNPRSDRRRIRSLFPFDRLPIDVQHRILALLPITTLIVCKAVSRSWRSLVSSPDFTDSYPRHLSRRRHDILFLFLFLSDSENQTSFSAYLPSQDRWLRFPLPMPFFIVHTAGTSLLLHKSRESQYSVVNPFAPHTQPHMLPQPLDLGCEHRPLAFIENNRSDYRIIMVSTSSDRSYFQIYHSETAQWEPCGQLDRGFTLLGCAVYLDGMLFCLASSRKHIVTFDLDGGGWTILDVELPDRNFGCRRMLVFGGEIYLTGCVLKDVRIERIGIWELDRSAMTWREFSFMPAEYFDQFIGSKFPVLYIVGCMGMICFYTKYPRKIVMCDLIGRRWWWPRPWPCDVSRNETMWLAHAIEPYIDLLK